MLRDVKIPAALLMLSQRRLTGLRLREPGVNSNVCIRFAMTLAQLLPLPRFCANLRKRKVIQLARPRDGAQATSRGHTYLWSHVVSFYKLVMLEMVVQLK